ncbi:MAG: Trk system potassium transporter TrkA [Syntrophomonas sp.]|uniref:Trk system potassium transporter TrkA n=1 Tax=Syntrophomonas sp. TaxID=2053627 RepID=UPI00261AA568|nr:Trk system potassium transporter TrkA [Syntrophomonas sp.]MDD2510553.1 Trk system potassium transporter TrkA [Syntrophomonas sp.]MDD4626676.1 Trk system potassium transporter TrkA [Syntrophomonas sp.]
MKAIIIGAGKVGFSMAEMLSEENHDVVVIEQSSERQQILEDTLDIQVINGSASSFSVLEAAGVKDADLLLAVTEFDELNMLACMLAKHYGTKVTVARVRNTEYLELKNISLNQLMGIDLIINPERVTAFHIAQIVKNPEALNVDYYAEGKVQLVELRIRPDSPLVGKTLKDVDSSLPYNIVSILRKHKMIVPRGQDTFYPGDHINLMAQSADIAEVEKLLGFYRHKINQVTILGGGRTGYHLAQILEEQKLLLNIKIIEKDFRRAERISEKLKNTLVIHGDGSDYQLLDEENIGQSDIFVAVTDDDKINMLCSLIAKNLGVKTTICQLKRFEVIPLVEQIDIDIVLSPRILTAGAILKYIRRGDIVSVTVLGEEKAEMLELFAQPGSVAVNKKIQDIKFPRGSVVGAVVRGEQVIVPDGNFKIDAFDRVIVFTLPKDLPRVEKLFLKGAWLF